MVVLDNVKVCLCKVAGEYMNIVHLEKFAESTYPIPVRTKVIVDIKDITFSAEDPKRCTGYIANSFAFTLTETSSEIFISINGKEYDSGITLNDLNY